MRRLFLVAILLAPPSVAKADEFPPWFGCSGSNCYSVVLVPYQPTVFTDPSRYLYDLTCPANANCGDWLFERVTLFDANNAAVYSRGRGNIGAELRGTPVTGALTFSTLDQAAGVTTPHTVVLTTTPEPVTMVLMGTGLVVLGAVRQRRRRVGTLET